MSRHVSAEVVARYREDDLSGRKAARVGSHLSGCAQCSAVSSDVAAVSSLLASVPAPPMPDLLAVRIEGVIASEAAARAARIPAAPGRPATAGTAADLPGAQIPGRPDLPQRSRHRVRSRQLSWSSPIVLRGLAGAAAVAVVAGGGYLLANSGAVPGTASKTSAGAPARSVHGEPAAQGSTGAVPRAAINSVSVNYGKFGNYRTAVATASGVDYVPSTLASQVRREVASSGAAYSQASVPAPAPSAKSASGARIGAMSVLALVGCLTRLVAGQTVLLADVASYLGNPALIIVTRPRSSPTDVFEVTIAGLACSASNTDLIRQVTIPSS